MQDSVNKNNMFQFHCSKNVVLRNNEFGQKPEHTIFFIGDDRPSVSDSHLALIDKGNYGTVRAIHRSMIVRVHNSPLIKNAIKETGAQIIEA
jgi:hypothetical protein